MSRSKMRKAATTAAAVGSAAAFEMGRRRGFEFAPFLQDTYRHIPLGVLTGLATQGVGNYLPGHLSSRVGALIMSTSVAWGVETDAAIRTLHEIGYRQMVGSWKDAVVTVGASVLAMCCVKKTGNHEILAQNDIVAVE